jgi:hypothetical protein
MTAFLLCSPLALKALGGIGGSDWTELSSIGQAYGGVAAIFGMLALGGVTASLAIQSRDSAANRELHQRTLHTELLLRALDDPKLRECWGPSHHSDEEQDRQHFYTNTIVSFWRSMFEIGKITEDQLLALSTRMFSSPPGQRYWSIAGPHRGAHYLSDRDARFIEILNLAHAEATNPPPNEP